MNYQTDVFYGATYCTDSGEDFGTITSIFEVDSDWDGYRFHGYCIPTVTEVHKFNEEI